MAGDLVTEIADERRPGEKVWQLTPDGWEALHLIARGEVPFNEGARVLLRIALIETAAQRAKVDTVIEWADDADRRHVPLDGSDLGERVNRLTEYLGIDANVNTT